MKGQSIINVTPKFAYLCKNLSFKILSCDKFQEKNSIKTFSLENIQRLATGPKSNDRLSVSNSVG